MSLPTAGCGTSAFFVLCSVIASQHFNKWRGTAISLLWSFQCLSAFFTPRLLDYFRTEYGTQEMFLLLGALTMNVIPAALAIRSPPWVTGENAPRRTTSKNSRLSSITREEPLLGRTPELDGHQHVPPKNDSAIQYHKEDGILARSHDGSSPSTKLRVNVRRCASRIAGHPKLKEFFTVTFYLDALSYGMIFSNFTTFLLIYADLAQDRHIEANQYVYLVGCHSIGDMAMRLLSGFLIDRGFISVETAVITSFLGTAFAFQLLAWSASVILISCSSLLLGAFVGLVVGIPVLVILNDFKNCCLSITLGGVYFFQGLALLPRPTLIGTKPFFNTHVRRALDFIIFRGR